MELRVHGKRAQDCRNHTDRIHGDRRRSAPIAVGSPPSEDRPRQLEERRDQDKPQDQIFVDWLQTSLLAIVGRKVPVRE